MQEVQFGRKYHDVITGFEGVAIGIVEYLSGCNQALLAPPVGNDGIKNESHWIDIQRLKSAKDNKVIALDDNISKQAPKIDVQLGKKYREKFTGFEGIAIGRTKFIAGNAEILLAPKVGGNGERRESSWFPEIHLIAVSDEVVALANAEKPGCDLAAPKRQGHGAPCPGR